MAAQRLLGWPRQVSVEARNIVLGVLKSHNEPMSTHELFEKAVKVPSRPRANGQPLTPSARYLKSVKPAPPHPNHPVRSLSFLKRGILEDLVRTRDIKKVHMKRVLTSAEVEQRMSAMSKAQLKKTSAEALSQPVSTWTWQLVGKSTKPVRLSKDEGAKVAFGVEVGVGADWSHLNRRRRRARGEKVARDVSWMRKVQSARASEENGAGEVAQS